MQTQRHIPFGYGIYVCSKKPKNKHELFLNLIKNIFSEKRYKIIGLEINQNDSTPDGCYVRKIIN